jgi:hypothetical protein
MVGVAGAPPVIELFLVRVLAELVLCTLLRCMSCGFAPLFSSWPSCDHPSAEKAPFRISGNVGIFDPTSPVACHMPNGGLLFKKVSFSDKPRVRLPKVAPDVGLGGFRSGVEAALALISDCMGVSEGKGSDLSCGMVGESGGGKGLDARFSRSCLGETERTDKGKCQETREWTRHE